MFKTGHKHSQETKRKIGKSNSVALKGRNLSKKTRGKISEAKRGNTHKKETRMKMSLAKMGKPLSEAHRRKLSESHMGLTAGSKNSNWKGGITPIHKLIRNSAIYKLWRESVFKRDNWTCKFCGKRGVELQADHIKTFAYFPKLRFDIDNGRTLCVDCHRKTDTYAGRAKVASLKIPNR